MELHLKQKVLSLLFTPLSPALLPPTIQLMALAYQRKIQTIKVILKTAQSHSVNQYVNIYHGLTQAIMNQKHNIVKTAKNAIIEIKKDDELKGNLGNNN